MKALIVVGLSLSVSAAAGQAPQPPAGSPPLLRTVEFRFPTQGNVPQRGVEDYVMQAEVVRHVSAPMHEKWVPYAEAEPYILADADRYWTSGQFETLWVEVRDWPFANGVIGRQLVFNFVERPDVAVPASDHPTPPPEYRVPPPDYERLYPPSE